jgi:hypothetical protein
MTTNSYTHKRGTADPAAIRERVMELLKVFEFSEKRNRTRLQSGSKSPHPFQDFFEYSLILNSPTQLFNTSPINTK